MSERQNKSKLYYSFLRKTLFFAILISFLSKSGATEKNPPSSSKSSATEKNPPSSSKSSATEKNLPISSKSGATEKNVPSSSKSGATEKNLPSSSKSGATKNNDNFPTANTPNWTTCEAFLYNTTFDKVSIAEIDWKIFYSWTPDNEPTYNCIFHIPSKTLIDRFRVELEGVIDPPVNWTTADLFLETTVDFSALFIQTNVSGLYRIIPSYAFHLKGLPVLLFALKLVEPGYLGVANCQRRLAYAMAPVQSMPNKSELVKAAAGLNFTNGYGHPVTDEDDFRFNIEESSNSQDNADDDDLMIEMNSDNMDIF